MVVGACIWRFAPVHPPWIRGALGPASSHHYALRVCGNIRTDEGYQDRGNAEVHPDECRACSRFEWWMPESQS